MTINIDMKLAFNFADRIKFSMLHVEDRASLYHT